MEKLNCPMNLLMASGMKTCLSALAKTMGTKCTVPGVLLGGLPAAVAAIGRWGNSMGGGVGIVGCATRN